MSGSRTDGLVRHLGGPSPGVVNRAWLVGYGTLSHRQESTVKCTRARQTERHPRPLQRPRNRTRNSCLFVSRSALRLPSPSPRMRICYLVRTSIPHPRFRLRFLRLAIMKFYRQLRRSASFDFPGRPPPADQTTRLALCNTLTDSDRPRPAAPRTNIYDKYNQISVVGTARR
jgi:hypothetical protein